MQARMWGVHPLVEGRFLSNFLNHFDQNTRHPCFNMNYANKIIPHCRGKLFVVWCLDNVSPKGTNRAPNLLLQDLESISISVHTCVRCLPEPAGTQWHSHYSPHSGDLIFLQEHSRHGTVCCLPLDCHNPESSQCMSVKRRNILKRQALRFRQELPHGAECHIMPG